jgi:hypothetical protein
MSIASRGQLSRRSYGGGAYSRLDILSGNIFSCNYLPEKDESLASYSCGSNQFDQSLYTLSALTALFLLMAVAYLILSHLSSSLPSRLRWGEIFLWHCRSVPDFAGYPLDPLFKQQQHLSSAAQFGLSLRALLSFLFRYLCLLLLLTAPLYLMKSVNSTNGDDSATYATHTHTYRWFATVAFLSGQLPASILLSITFVLLLVFSVYLLRMGRDKAQLESASVEVTFLSLRIVLIFFTNLVFVGTANALYIWSTLRQYSSETHIRIQISLAIFKLIWGFILLPMLFPSSLKGTKRGVQLMSLTNIMNTVIIPSVVTAMTSPSCYQVSKEPLPSLS